jgi:hypothetical protein
LPELRQVVTPLRTELFSFLYDLLLDSVQQFVEAKRLLLQGESFLVHDGIRRFPASLAPFMKEGSYLKVELGKNNFFLWVYHNKRLLELRGYLLSDKVVTYELNHLDVFLLR